MSFAAPFHVPAHLYCDLELKAFAAQFEDPFVGIQALQDRGELIYMRDIGRGTPGWVPTRFEILSDIFMDAKRFSNAENIGVGPLMGVDWRLNPLEYDPPEHMGYRQVLQPYFQPSKVTGYEALIRSVARELIARFDGKRQIDFVAEFASLFPSYIFLDLLGLPREELPQFFEWEHAFTRSPDMAVRAAGARSILHYLENYVEQRRSDPRDDLVTGIINGQVKGRPLNHGEIMGMVMVL
ncbi:MAG: cytochrome P450, partial [Sphingomonadaceae bacterium]|nr:cytochrome P450 [Sphingomonadaceae bacterium]